MDDGRNKTRKPNPSEHACFLSALTYFYALPIFITGWKRNLQEADLYQTLDDAHSNDLGDKLENAWNEELVVKSNMKPSLWKTAFKVFKWDYFKVAWQALLSESLHGVVAYCDAQLLKYFRPGQQDITDTMAYCFTGGMILCSLVATTLTHNFMHQAYLLSMRLRIACCSLIYRKSLRLSRTALEEGTHGGHIINMMSNDVDKFTYPCVDASYLWLDPLLCIVFGYLIYLDVGIAAVSGMVILVGCIPIQMVLSYIVYRYRRKGAAKTDGRVRLINEVVSSIQVIKMCTWEEMFSRLVGNGRRDEMKSISSKFQIKGALESFFMFTTRLSIFATMLTYVMLGNTIQPEQMFIIFLYHMVLRAAFTLHLPESMTGIAESDVAITRIRDFLLLEEVQPHDKGNALADEWAAYMLGVGKYTNKEDRTPSIELKDVTAGRKGSAANALNKINLEARNQRLLTILGPIGSGKSSLLQVILKELPITSGTMEIVGMVSYASQEPWLFSGTVRQNIIFGLPMNEARYQNVVRVCALRRDLQLLPYSDLTMVGDRGFTLSGGQRARINLARALYKDADIYLLDDPLSAVDATVGQQIFEDCFCSYLKQKIVILTTNQLQFLKDLVHIVYLKDGALKGEGTYQQLLNMNLDLKELNRANINKECSEPQNKNLVPEALYEKQIDENQNKERNINESASVNVYFKYFKGAGNSCLVLLVLVLFISAQFVGSCSDFFVSLWGNMEQTRRKAADNKYKYISSDNDSTDLFNDEPIFTPINGETEDDMVQQNLILIIYSSVCISVTVLSFARSSAFYYMISRISTMLHTNMFNSALRATMGFFTEHNAGKILNRFSNDMAIVDEVLPPTMMRCVQMMLSVFGVAITIIFVKWWFLIQIIMMAMFARLIGKVYLRTSKPLTHMERSHRSPLYGHVNATLQGLTTVRAFKAQEILRSEFDTYQDLLTSAWYTFFVVTRTFGYWLDVSATFFTASIVLTYVISGSETYIGNVGLAITQAISLSRMFQWAVRQSGEMMNQMTSVERILEYSRIDNEKDPESPQKLPDEWPSLGRIEFRKVSLFYDPNEPPVLCDLNFIVQPREKVGVVGRTGAGKSSLVNALFQLFHTKGQILIDGEDITKIRLNDLRSKLSIIPQQPILFFGSLAYNLDPSNKCSDADVWQALEDVELKEYVRDLNCGLHLNISEDGSNFSVGQRQLLCLARAILCNNQILILDEATANIDHQTDMFIQKTIRKKFRDCTVLTVAHRLNTVIDSDKILVMDAGKVVEYGCPYKLLHNKSGHFYRMVSKSGSFDEMYKVAESCYHSGNT